MNSRRYLFTALALALSSTVSAQAIAAPAEQPITFEARGGETVEAFSGTLSVPMNRNDPNSAMTELAYVRFPATTATPGAPIIYLSGGPGGSGIGTAKGRRFPLFMAMRQHGDVIAFDQRGTGASSKPPFCTSSESSGDDTVMSDAEFAEAWQSAARECAAFWQKQGVDLAGYTTLESVADLSALRNHFGAEKVTLWGISYGSHLALAALANIPDEIDRVVIASAEGLDQTVKLPARTISYFARLQAAVDEMPQARALYPDITALMGRVHGKLDAEPVAIAVPLKDGTTFDFLLQRRHVQQFASGLISDPDSAAIMLALYAQLDSGDTSLAAMMLQRFYAPGKPIGMSAMSAAMDRASGISPARFAAFQKQAPASPIGAYLNFPMPQILGEFTELDLGETFRSGPFDDTPVLLLTGTLDGRTYPEGQTEAVSGLSNVTQVIVKNAGHNLFMTSPEVGDVMHAFMRSETVEKSVIDLPTPDLSKLPDFGG